jgi:5-methylcytosine-specific restriction protein B
MDITIQSNFEWTTFYSEFADRLLPYKQNRRELLSLFESAHNQVGLSYTFMDKGEPLGDICPFTVFGAFNKGIKTENRIAIMKALGDRIGVKSQPPSNFDGIPVVNNMRVWFFGDRNDRQPEDINNLWNMFEASIRYSDQPTDNNCNTFIHCYDTVTKQRYASWNITMGLYWIRPYSYINLDTKNRQFLIEDSYINSLDIRNISDLKKLPDAEKYLRLIDVCKTGFSKKGSPFHNFPELSYIAYKKNTPEPFIQILKPSNQAERTTNEKHYWLYAPGEGSRKWEEFYSQGLMGIGWDELGDLTQYKNKEDMRAKMKESYDETKSYRNDSLATWQFSHSIREGDIVFAKKGMHSIIGRGVVESDYQFIPERNEYKHIRKIKWTNIGNWAHPGQAAMKTLTDITAYTDYVRQLECLITDNEDIEEIESEPEIIYEQYTDANFLNEVFMDPQQYEILLSLLKTKKNLILQGAPGVGKTFAAKRLAYSIIGSKDTSRVMMVQFHQSYSYEDFIMGFRPTEDGFKLTPGPFYEFCKTAEDDIDRDYFFIIDEINRGNLSKIFGELLMLIECDKRNEKLRLLYSNELFSVPSNVHIIGLMNTADRSLAIIDYALRRRFAFYEIEPAFDSNGFQSIVKKSNYAKFPSLINCIKSLNEAISQDESLGNGFRIGHSYFCTNKKITTDLLNAIIKFELLPLLNEYWFDEKSKIETWAKKLHGTLND